MAEVPSTDPEFVLSSFRACYGVLRFIMESGAKGCEVVVSGKLRGQRAKSMKFVDGLMIHSGDPVNYYVDTAVRHVLLRQGEWLSLLVSFPSALEPGDLSCRRSVPAGRRFSSAFMPL